MVAGHLGESRQKAKRHKRNWEDKNFCILVAVKVSKLIKLYLKWVNFKTYKSIKLI